MILARFMKFLTFLISIILSLFLAPQVHAQYDGSYDGGYDGGYQSDNGGNGGGGGGGGNANDGGYGGTTCNPCDISGHVYKDYNQDATFNSGDQALSGQVVSLYYNDHRQSLVTSATTDANGHYIMTNVPALGQSYRISHTTPLSSGYSRTTPVEYGFQLRTNRYFDFGVYGNVLEQNQPTVASCSINTSWTSYQGASNYGIIIDDPDDNISPNGAINAFSNNATNKSLNNTNGLIAGHRYSFVIAALDSSNNPIAYSDNGQWSHQKFGTYTTYPDCNPPQPPTLSTPTTNLCVNRPGTDDHQITFKFDPNPANAYVLAYYLYRDGVQIDSTTPGNPYINVYLSPGESHQYAGKVLTAGGLSAYSNTFNFTGINCASQPPPAAPTLNIVTNDCVTRPGTDDHQITFEFVPANGTTNVNTYQLFRDNALFNSTTASNPYIDTFLSPNESHSYYAKVITDTGTSAQSNTQNITGRDCSSATGPGDFTWHYNPTPACTGGTSQMTIYWNVAPGATGYNIRPQTNNTQKGNNGWIPEFYIGYPAIQAGTYQQYTYDIPGAIANNEGWEFTITAIDSSNPPKTSTTVTGSTYYTYGWTNAYKCTIPDTQLSITTTAPQAQTVNAVYSEFRQVTVNQNSSATLNWHVENALSATTSWGQAVNLVGGNATGTFNVPTSTVGSTNYQINASNASGSSLPLSIQVNVIQYPPAYIQTTGGDIHTNESINVSP